MKSGLRSYVVLAAVVPCLCLWSFPGSRGTVLAASASLATDSGAGAPLTPAPRAVQTVTIPGPLRSFMRMAAISQKASPDDVVPLLARNIYMQGYQSGTPTELLKLLDKYVRQARELQILAGSTNTIRVNSCDEAGTLIQILGYRLRSNCGQKNISLETANPERAFLTIDSGFPLTDLEEALQKGVPFSYPYAASKVPVLLRESDWLSLSATQKVGYGNFLDILLNDPNIARLYWALNKVDTGTRESLQGSPGLPKLLPFAAVLDFYGSQISIRSGKVVVPGDAAAEPAWKELVGVSSTQPGEFVLRLVAKDNGWLAAYFDVLSRVNTTQRVHLTQNPRMKHLYEDFRLTETKPGATRSVFRQAPDLLVLDTRLDWEPNGDPHVPGNMEVWKQILLKKTKTKSTKDWSKRFQTWDQPDQLLEALTAFGRTETDSGPLQMYLMMCQMDKGRPAGQRLSPETVSLLASKFPELNSWYLVFSEFPELHDESIAKFIHATEVIDKISNPTLHGNVLGIFQANAGLWQILARQREIPEAEMNASWQKTLDPFTKITESTQLFDAARSSVQVLMAASTGKAGTSPGELIGLLAGPAQVTPDGKKMQDELATRIHAVLEDQRLVSLDTLFALSDGLGEMERTGKKDDDLLTLAGELRGFEMPRPIFTNSEKINWAPKVYSSHHAELQVQTDLTKVINGQSTKAQLETARGQLTPFLRDTLVGLNYAYYEPPSSQMLHNNPLFVRSHDFVGVSIIGSDRIWQSPVLLGAGMSAGGGAYLMGSLSDLPYALAQTEEDFIAPENVQALVWKELVPDLLSGATLPRWWGVTQNEMHAAALYQKFGEELLRGSVKNAELRGKVTGILAERLAPKRMELLETSLHRPEDMATAIPFLLPADTFYLAAEFRSRYPGDEAMNGLAGQQLEALAKTAPAEMSPERISHDFGVPHPTLARTNSRELLNVKPFPFFGGYSSRLFGESWESSNLYWARLADDMGYSPVMLNRLVPELTRRMISKIFATDLEDWPAMLRALQETGEEIRQRKTPMQPVVSANTFGADPARDGKEQ